MKNDLFKEVENLLSNYKMSKAKVRSIDLSIEELLIQLDEEGNLEIKQRIEQLEKEKRVNQIQVDKVENMLSILDDKEYNIIKLRYIDKQKYKDIATLLGHADEYIIHLKNKVINKKLVPLYL